MCDFARERITNRRIYNLIIRGAKNRISLTSINDRPFVYAIACKGVPITLEVMLVSVALRAIGC